MATHEVTNQAPPLVGYDVFSADAALVDAVRRYGGETHLEELATLGRMAGSEQARQWATEADRNPPVLQSYDRYGNRIDEVAFHPSWHRLVTVAVENGLHAAPWREPADTGGHLGRAAKFYMWSQVEAGHGCPISMTYAAVPALRSDDDLAAEWEPLLTARQYDPGLRPAASKAGVFAGMGMTEKQGGTDVRANTTRAVPVSGGYLLTGHKWFCSAPMSDVFLVLAQAPGGLTCFVVPRVMPDGTRNVFRLQRLKDKLGNRSNASAEVEFEATWGQRLGDEGRGISTIIEMVSATRLDCILGSAALMRRAVAEATHHCAYRRAFDTLLADTPLMRNVLADLAVESEAATTLAMRLAAAVDRSADTRGARGTTSAAAATETESEFLRLAVALGKYWVCKRAPTLVGEALECLGGNGYVEDSGMPRLYREAPLNSIWEGSGNVNTLDVLRALRRSPAALDAYLAEIGLASGADARFDAAVKDLLQSLAELDGMEARARRLAERMALVLQGSLLLRHGDPAVADAFCASRLDQDWGNAFGTLPRGVDTAAIVSRATPKTLD